MQKGELYNMKISKRFFSLLPLCAVPLFNLTSCSVNSKIVFANYESYLSDDVIDKYQNDYSFLYYTTNEDIEVKFKRSYDAAVPSTYEMLRLMKKGLLAQID
jgi:spermidine/putrescine-binding protein